MVEVSEIGFGEEEIELDLRLSIGGSFRKPEKPRPVSKSNLFDSDLREHHHQSKDGERERSMVGVCMDAHAKREVHALRRQEAKKKREEKQQKKRWMMRESEVEEQQQEISKREKTGHVRFNDGFAFPCWALIANEKNVVPSPAPPACGGFQPFSVNGGDGSEQNDERGGVNGSSMCSSSVVSEQQSSSHEGGGSTDSHSHSTHSLAESTQLNCSNVEHNIRSRPEQSASSHPVRSKHGNVEGGNRIVKEIHPKITHPETTKLKEESTMNSKAVPIDKPLSNEKPINGPSKETKTDMGKPPKPLSQTSSLPPMPYVSTTGNGPNGKTVNGFLYRYTKSEVSIVCVCHGSTFSPAEFVQHAGGTDISQPLRHITVIPSAFG